MPPGRPWHSKASPGVTQVQGQGSSKTAAGEDSWLCRMRRKSRFIVLVGFALGWFSLFEAGSHSVT